MILKYIILIIIIILSYTSLCGSDLRTREKIAPGVYYYHDYQTIGPWHIHIIEINLDNPAVTLESIKAENSIFARQKTSVMSEQADGKNHQIVGAINADFFEWNGEPVGAQVVNGLLINLPTDRSVFGISGDKIPFIDSVNWQGQFITSQNTIHNIDKLNRRREKSELTLYNSYYQEDTLSLMEGLRIETDIISENTTVNDTMDLIVSTVQKSAGVIIQTDKIIPEKMILVASPEYATEIQPGDTVQILFSLPPRREPIQQLIGGLPRIIRDGQVSIEWKKERIRENFSITRHPRTAVGYTKDKQKVFLFVVDGRQPGYSLGMTLPELAAYMLDWNIYQGVNLDGGGSTTMVVQGAIVNKPSDASGERPVANALMVVSSEPSDTTKVSVIDTLIYIPEK